MRLIPYPVWTIHSSFLPSQISKTSDLFLVVSKVKVLKRTSRTWENICWLTSNHVLHHSGYKSLGFGILQLFRGSIPTYQQNDGPGYIFRSPQVTNIHQYPINLIDQQLWWVQWPPQSASLEDWPVAFYLTSVCLGAGRWHGKTMVTIQKGGRT